MQSEGKQLRWFGNENEYTKIGIKIILQGNQEQDFSGKYLNTPREERVGKKPKGKDCVKKKILFL